ncbi:MAG: hypothetical protein HYY64_00970 [Candidatus Rokubacteria bacterium]|nr:hypothetical protein [Candidatus Rokubacteria bacterium]
MRRNVFLSATVTAFLAVCVSNAGASHLRNPYIATYPIDSAIIHYVIHTQFGHGDMSGPARGTTEDFSGTQTVYLKGEKLAKVTKMTLPAGKGKTTTVGTLQIYTADHIFTLDLIQKTGTKIDNPKRYGKAEYDKLSEGEKEAFHERMRTRGVISFDLPYVGKKVGTATILGHTCDVYQLGEEPVPEKLFERLQTGQDFSMNTCLWEGAIPLRVLRSRFARSEELLATKIEKNVEIADSHFEVPRDIKIVHDDQTSELERRYALGRFHLYKTGKPMVIRVPVKEESGAVKKQGEAKEEPE